MKEWCNCWPSTLQFRAPATAPVETLSNAELRAMVLGMRAALNEASAAATGTDGQCAAGAALVDAEGRVCARASRTSAVLGHAVFRCVDALAALQRQRQGQLDASTYLCSGLWLATSCEPCPMCAMAAVHSRVAAVVYARPNAAGALGSCFRLHSLRALNHHFPVYAGLFANHQLP